MWVAGSWTTCSRKYIAPTITDGSQKISLHFHYISVLSLLSTSSVLQYTHTIIFPFFTVVTVSLHGEACCTSHWSECECYILYVPGSLSSIVINVMLGEPITAALGGSVEVITTMKTSDSSVAISSTIDTVKVADG